MSEKIMEQFLEGFGRETLTSVSEASRAKVSPMREKGSVSKVLQALSKSISDFLMKCVPVSSSTKTSQECYHQTMDETFASSSSALMKSGIVSRGECWTLNMSEHTDFLSPFPNADGVSSLSDILEPIGELPLKYCLSRKACLGLLRRAESRQKELPPSLKRMLMEQAEWMGWVEEQREKAKLEKSNEQSLFTCSQGDSEEETEDA